MASGAQAIALLVATSRADCIAGTNRTSLVGTDRTQIYANCLTRLPLYAEPRRVLVFDLRKLREEPLRAAGSGVQPSLAMAPDGADPLCQPPSVALAAASKLMELCAMATRRSGLPDDSAAVKPAARTSQQLQLQRGGRQQWESERD